MMAGMIPARSGRREGTPVRKSMSSHGSPRSRMSYSSMTSASSRIPIAAMHAP